MEGTIKVLEARAELENELFDKLKIKKAKMNNSSYSIESYKSELVDMIVNLMGTMA